MQSKERSTCFIV